MNSTEFGEKVLKMVQFWVNHKYTAKETNG